MQTRLMSQYNEKGLIRKSWNNNGQNQFFWACKNEHLQQTIVLTKTAGHQSGSGHFFRSFLPVISSGHCFRRKTRNSNDRNQIAVTGDNKQLLDEVFVTFWIIKVEVGVISRSRRVKLITLTETLIILDITTTEHNNCFVVHWIKRKW